VSIAECAAAHVARYPRCMRRASYALLLCHSVCVYVYVCMCVCARARD
jgi:hypothetical protein